MEFTPIRASERTSSSRWTRPPDSCALSGRGRIINSENGWCANIWYIYNIVNMLYPRLRRIFDRSLNIPLACSAVCNSVCVVLLLTLISWLQFNCILICLGNSHKHYTWKICICIALISCLQKICMNKKLWEIHYNDWSKILNEFECSWTHMHLIIFHKIRGGSLGCA